MNLSPTFDLAAARLSRLQLRQKFRPFAARQPRSDAALQHPQTGGSRFAQRDRRVTVSSAEILLKKSAFFLTLQSCGPSTIVVSGCLWHHRHQLRQFSQVLDCGGQEEFVLRAIRPPQAQAVEPHDALEMG